MTHCWWTLHDHSDNYLLLVLFVQGSAQDDLSGSQALATYYQMQHFNTFSGGKNIDGGRKG